MTHTQTTLPPREMLSGAAPAAVLERLPDMGRVMVIVRAGGATHERIGPVETVRRVGGAVRLAGACHDALIDIGPIAAIGIDRSSVMQGRVYPRLNFLDASGEVMVAVVGMDGLDAFEAALAGFARIEDQAAVKPTAKIERPDLAQDDPCRAPFDEVAALGGSVVITAQSPGVTQSWQGRIETVKPAMGFANVMTPDFHLHLEGGSITGWQRKAGQRVAIGKDGHPTGLTLTSDSFA